MTDCQGCQEIEIAAQREIGVLNAEISRLHRALGEATKERDFASQQWRDWNAKADEAHAKLDCAHKTIFATLQPGFLFLRVPDGYKIRRPVITPEMWDDLRAKGFYGGAILLGDVEIGTWSPEMLEQMGLQRRTDTDATRLRKVLEDVRDAVNEQECRGDEDCDHCQIIHHMIAPALAEKDSNEK